MSRQGVGGEDADGGQQELRACLLPAFQGHGPCGRRVIPMRGLHRAAELHVPAQVELVGDVVQVFQRVRLGGEMLLPVPFLHQLLGKRIAIGPAFGIEAGARIAVPVPGAADIGAGLEHPRGHAQLAQAVEHEYAGNPGANDDRVVFLDLILVGLFRDHWCLSGMVSFPRSSCAMLAGVFPRSSCAMLATDQREGYKRHFSPGLATTQPQETLSRQYSYPMV